MQKVFRLGDFVVSIHYSGINRVSLSTTFRIGLFYHLTESQHFLFIIFFVPRFIVIVFDISWLIGDTHSVGKRDL